MLKKVMMNLSLVFGVLALSACGANGIEVTDPSSARGALEEESDSAEVEVDADCMDQCVEKGESEEDCVYWCSGDKVDDKVTWCLEGCIEKGESEEDCEQWCADYSKDDCYDKDDKDEWGDKDEYDYEDKDESGDWADYEDK